MGVSARIASGGQMVTLTDGCNEVVEVAVRKQGLRKLSEEQFQGPGDDVHVFPLAVLQVQLLCIHTRM